MIKTGTSFTNETIPTVQLLETGDAFMIQGVNFYIKKAVAVANVVSPAEHAKAVLRTFPNPLVFPVANEADNLEAIFNGFFNLQIDDKTFISAMPTLSLRRVAQAQEGFGQGGAGNNQIQMDQFDQSMYGLASITPSITISGTSSVQSQIVLPASVDLGSGAATSNNYGVLIYAGFLIKGGARRLDEVNARAQASMKVASDSKRAQILTRRS
jgi:hypothetical protein